MNANAISESENTNEQIMATVQCKKCQMHKMKDAFEKDRSICKQCRYIQKSESVAKKPKVETGKPCDECSKEFNKDEFKYKADKNRYNNICKSCFNAKGYSQKSRANKRKMDEVGYLQNAKEAQQAFRDKDIAITDEKRCTYRNKPEIKIKEINKSARDRGLSFHEDDFEKMQEKLSRPCTYCNNSAEIKINGLDRIDNSRGYSDANTLPCCKICNYMKGSLTLTEFLERIKKIYENKTDLCTIKFQDKIDGVARQPLVNSTKSESEKASFAITSDIPKFPNAHGRKIAIYDNETKKIGKMFNTITHLCDILHVPHTSGWAKLKNKENIWLQPNWRVKYSELNDCVSAETSIYFDDCLNNQNKSKINNKKIESEASSNFTNNCPEFNDDHGQKLIISAETSMYNDECLNNQKKDRDPWTPEESYDFTNDRLEFNDDHGQKLFALTETSMHNNECQKKIQKSEPSKKKSNYFTDGRPTSNDGFHGRKIVIYDRGTNKIGRIFNTIAHLCDILHMQHTTGWYKLKNKENIWLQPNWCVKNFESNDCILEETALYFEKCLNNHNENANIKFFTKKLKFYAEKEDKKYAFKSLSKMSEFLKTPTRTINNFFNIKNYKSSDETKIEFNDFILISVYE
jgi:hypothetical protein